MSDSITFIVPTLRRSEHLRRSLRAIGDQTRTAQEILVGIKPEDEESRAVVNEFAGNLPVREVRAEGVGVVGSMNSCLAAATGAYIALLDDDVEIPPHWAATMLEHLRCHPGCVAAGGRDILLDYPEMRRAEPLVHDVGRMHWYGRVTGQHHRAGGAPRPVDVLRGSNILFRGDFLRAAGFESELRGKGAQVSWEIVLGLKALAEGKRMFLDPGVHVLHHVAPRHDDDTVHRGVFSAKGTENMAFNETFVVLRYDRGVRRLTTLIWQLVVGSPACPGSARLTELLTPRRRHLLHRLYFTLKGRLAAVIAIFKSREGGLDTNDP
jgi:glycosyltransferase involved in cell wall biosynthesis